MAISMSVAMASISMLMNRFLRSLLLWIVSMELFIITLCLQLRQRARYLTLSLIVLITSFTLTRRQLPASTMEDSAEPVFRRRGLPTPATMGDSRVLLSSHFTVSFNTTGSSLVLLMSLGLLIVSMTGLSTGLVFLFQGLFVSTMVFLMGQLFRPGLWPARCA